MTTKFQPLTFKKLTKAIFHGGALFGAGLIVIWIGLTILLPETKVFSFKNFFVGLIVLAIGSTSFYEGLEKIDISGNDRILVTGLGPVGLAALMLSKARGASVTIGIDVIPERLEIAKKLGLVDHVMLAGPDNVEEIRELFKGFAVEEVATSYSCAGANKKKKVTELLIRNF